MSIKSKAKRDKKAKAKSRKAHNSRNSRKSYTTPSLYGIGAFYKHNQDNGFGICLNRHQVGELVDYIHAGCAGTELAYSREIAEKFHSRESFVKFLFAQLDVCVSELNMECFGTPTQPPVITSVSKSLSDFSKDVITYLTLFFMNVHWLTENGYIQNDNYNGMQFVYINQ